MKKMVWILLIGLLISISTLVIGSGVYLPKEYRLEDDIYDPELSAMTELQFYLIHGGLRASSSHNMQPWKIIILDDTRFELHADIAKALPVIDPNYQQMLMSQGTFLESLQDAADTSGITITIEPATPDLSQGATKIATIEIVNEPILDDWTVAGATSTENENQAVSFSISAGETLFVGMDDIYRTWIDNDQLETFQTLLLEAMTLEANHLSAMEELLGIFRFTRYEKNKHRYGLSLNTMTPIMQTMIEPIMNLTATPTSFGASSINPFKTRLKSEHTYLVLSMENPTAWDYVEIGRWTQRLANHFTDATVRPVVQLLEPLEGMSELSDAMIRTSAIPGSPMIILGFQEPQSGFHESLRHRVMDLINRSQS